MRPAIFLDRDGVVIENRSDYVRSWDDVEIYPEAISILSQLAASPYQIVLITNQSAVGRGIITLDVAQSINQRLVTALQEMGCRIDGVFMCPHAPEENCACRKPRPGLLLSAAQSLKIDLKNSIMVGDAWTDLQAGRAAGVGRLVLVRTGRGNQQLALPRPAEILDARVCADLPEALKDYLTS